MAGEICGWVPRSCLRNAPRPLEGDASGSRWRACPLRRPLKLQLPCLQRLPHHRKRASFLRQPACFHNSRLFPSRQARPPQWLRLPKNPPLHRGSVLLPMTSTCLTLKQHRLRIRRARLIAPTSRRQNQSPPHTTARCPKAVLPAGPPLRAILPLPPLFPPRPTPPPVQPRQSEGD